MRDNDYLKLGMMVSMKRALEKGIRKIKHIELDGNTSYNRGMSKIATLSQGGAISQCSSWVAIGMKS